MTAYWLGVLTGFVGISAAFAILQGNSIAATPAMLIVLLAIGGLDIPLMLVGARREWRGVIKQAAPSALWLFLAGVAVFVAPFIVAYAILMKFPGTSGLVIAWVALTLGVVICSWGMLYLLARGLGCRDEGGAIKSE